MPGSPSSRARRVDGNRRYSVSEGSTTLVGPLTCCAWQCQCDNQVRPVGFEVANVFASADACVATWGVCTSGELDGVGAPECVFDLEATAQGDCRGRADCTSPALLGETQVEVRESVNVSCAQQTARSWECICYAGAMRVSLVSSLVQRLSCDNRIGYAYRHPSPRISHESSVPLNRTVPPPWQYSSCRLRC